MRADRILENSEVSEKSITEQALSALITTGWSGNNKTQMKAVELLKGIALSDEPKANAFMKKLDAFTSSLKGQF